MHGNPVTEEYFSPALQELGVAEEVSQRSPVTEEYMSPGAHMSETGSTGTTTGETDGLVSVRLLLELPEEEGQEPVSKEESLPFAVPSELIA